MFQLDYFLYKLVTVEHACRKTRRTILLCEDSIVEIHYM